MKYLLVLVGIGLLHFACGDAGNPVTGTKDTLYVRDTLIIRDSLTIHDSMTIKDTMVIKDTLVKKDTISRRDTLITRDTLFRKDTIFSKDTVFRKDTIFNKDTLIRRDTLVRKDTLIRRDTLVYIDSVLIRQTWSKLVDSIKTASYLIGLRMNSNNEVILIGSSSAINSTTLITNAHVWKGLLSAYILYKQNGQAVTPIAVRNGATSSGTFAYPLDIGGFHTDYSSTTVFTQDIGFFRLNQSLLFSNIFLPINDTIRNIKTGQEIGTIGYPGETSDRLNYVAYATFKDGTISALTPFDTYQTANTFNSLVVQHNFNTTGGTSGSPIFDNKGRLIAVNNSGAVTNVWNDATGSFTSIHTGSIGYGIRADIVNDMFANGRFVLDTISTWYIPKLYSFYPSSRICLRDGTRSVYMNTTMSAAQSAANALFSKTAPDYVLSNGSLYYTDNASYEVRLLKDPYTPDCMWSILIQAPTSTIYQPSFRDYWGITIGTSRSYILNTYGYSYTNTFSIDSSVYYYNYSALGIGFGFLRNESDWNCDAIQIAMPNYLMKRAAGAIHEIFPNPNISKSRASDKYPLSIKVLSK